MLIQTLANLGPCPKYEPVCFKRELYRSSTLKLPVLTRSESRQDLRRFEDLPKLLTSFATLKTLRDKALD